jgi:glycosyltransferase involved in cell wall biosynthesis
MKNKPLISIVTVVYNGEEFLEDTIKSVIEQSYESIEYIIIDGGSTDGTVDIIKKYEDKIDYWVSEPDSGISDAFNKGVQQSNGYILMLNAGDIFIHNNILENISKYLIEKIVVCEVLSVSGHKIGTTSYVNNRQKLARIPHQGAFVHKSVYNDIGNYSLGFKIRMDYDFFARATLKYQPYFISEVLVKFDNSGISSSLKHRLKFEIEGIIVEYLYFSKSLFPLIYRPCIMFFGSYIKNLLKG